MVDPVDIQAAGNTTRCTARLRHLRLVAGAAIITDC